MMSRLAAAAALTAAIAAPAIAPAQHRPTGQPRPSFSQPAISPDGREIAFVSGGDIWVVPATGGDAHLLVSHPANESRPMYSPDGKRVAFMSDRAGSIDIWILELTTGTLRRLTFDDGAEQLDAWSHDGKWIYFSSGAHDVGGQTDEYRMSADGGTPMIVSGERFFAEFMGAPSPDGSVIAVVARGMGQSQWWRKGRSHLDESELWLVRGDGSSAPAYQRLTPLGAKRQWPMWNADGRSIYFVSDEDGPQNLWSIAVGDSKTKQLTHFRDGRVLFPTITPDGRTIAFERDFDIWIADAASGDAKRVPIALRGAPAATAAEHLTLTNGFQDMQVSPDGRKIAFVARGEVFAVSAADGGDAMRVTRTPAVESQLSWAPDSRRLMYASNRDGAWHLYMYDFVAAKETQLTRGPLSDIQARWAPDGSQIAFVRDAREVHVIDVAGVANAGNAAAGSPRDRVIARGTFARPPFAGSGEGTITWSPDGKFVAYLSGGTKLMLNAYVAAVASGGGVELASSGGGEQVTYLSNTNGAGLSWSPDGTYLMLSSGMRTESPIVARVDLVPHVPKLREEQFNALFRDPPGRGTPASPPEPAQPGAPADSAARAPRAAIPHVRVVLDGIRDRLTVVPTGVETDAIAISRDGKFAALVANAAGEQNIYVYPLDENATERPVARQITSTAGRKTNVQWAPDGKSIWFLDQGRISNVAVDSRAVKQVAARAELDVDFDSEKLEVFNQAWEFLNDNYYDPNFHGTNWNAVHEQYAPLIAGARTTEEMRRLLSLMIGEMNGSHLGIAGPPTVNVPPPATGRLGVFFDRAAYEQRGVLKVTEVLPLSPAAISEQIKPGTVISAVDGVALVAHTSLDSLLDFKAGKGVTLTIADAEGAPARQVAMRAANAGTERGLLYRAWVDGRRAYVAKISGGRLGYVHMADMGANAINQMNLDLDSENHAKEGVVLDIRNNNGGFVNGYALDVLSRQPYVVMVRRGVPAVPGRPVLGQRALEAPTVLVTNQATLSDGENFTEGYRTMKLGKVVGEPTAGWDVYTGAGTMVDGTSVRLPFMRNGQLDGTPLELRPRAVDVPVERMMGESYAGRDTQLDAAVKELLAELDARPKK
ncbi:MAG TPA: LpqB family beta-propeller domain-containing protein [Gemmatimonadaceae bacterium]|jgi:Tol biopolymer transport system component|nr:LpqB family beta-propeller domain-containing protein [Gemmatimonadaceae bacterium]